MPRADFTAALDEAKKNLDGAMSAEADRRVRARLQGGPGRKRGVRWGRVTGAASVLALLLAAGLSLRSPGQPGSLGGFAVTHPSENLAATASAAAVSISTGGCVLRDEVLGSALEVTGPVRLRRLEDGVEVALGTVALDVDHARARPSPYRVRVSHGAIEVLGTQFTVVQREDGGEVTLHQGSIRFTADDGELRLLSPGQSLRWPLPPAAKPPVERAVEPAPVEPAPAVALHPRPKPPPPPVVVVEVPFDPAPLLEQLAVLRSRGQYEQSVSALTEALRERHAPATDERLSFELGAILTRQLQDPTRGCAHWRRHLDAFPAGRYQAEVAQAQAQLGCAGR